jgi:hypothetical protein
MYYESKSDLTEYLSTLNVDIGIFGVANWDGIDRPIYMHRYKEWNDDGSDWWLEAPVEIRKLHVVESEEEKKLIESEGYFVIDGVVIDVDCPQVSPFLPNGFTYSPFVDELECAMWMLKTNAIGIY